MEIYRRTSFSLHDKHTADGLAYVRFRLSMPGQGRREWPLRHKIAPAEWDAALRAPKPRSRAGAAVAREMRAWEEAEREAFSRYELIERRLPTLAEVAREMEEAVGRAAAAAPREGLVMERLDEFLDEWRGRRQLCDGTARNYMAFRNLLAKYDAGARMSDVDARWVEGFVRFCVSRGYRNTYTQSRLMCLMTFLHEMRRRGLVPDGALDVADIRIKGGGGRSHAVVYLTADELRAVEELPLAGDPRLGAARDAFVFCCYSGLRYSDLRGLRWADVHADHISVVTRKTLTPLRVELNAHTRALLGRRKPRGASEAVFAVPKLNVMNRLLREIGRMAGVTDTVRDVFYVGSERREVVKPKWELLSSHCARRTFVVMALRLGINAEVIMRWTGHSSFSSMKPYMDIVDERKRHEMAKFDDV